MCKRDVKKAPLDGKKTKCGVTRFRCKYACFEEDEDSQLDLKTSLNQQAPLVVREASVLSKPAWPRNFKR